MESPNIIRSRLEEIGLTQGQIDDVLPLLVKEPSPEKEVVSSIQELKRQMSEEEDYTKRAAIAAKIISLSLDTEY